MCRLLAVCTPTPEPLASALPSALTDFRELSHRHKDGWGAAWRTGEGLNWERDPDPAWASPRYLDVLSTIVSDQSLVHLRRASPGSVINIENCHPFVEGDIAFEHNGDFPVSQRLLEWSKEHGVRERRGSTDSEAYFGLVLHHGATMSWPDAIVAAAEQICDDLAVDDPNDAPESLNCLLSTPDALYAFTQYNPARFSADTAPDAYELRLQVRDDRVVITSSQWDVPDAITLPQWSLVTVQRNSLIVVQEQRARVSA